MQWSHPSYKNSRFGFEINMFIYMRPSAVVSYPRPKEAIYNTMLYQACNIPEYALIAKK